MHSTRELVFWCLLCTVIALCLGFALAGFIAAAGRDGAADNAERARIDAAAKEADAKGYSRGLIESATMQARQRELKEQSRMIEGPHHAA